LSSATFDVRPTFRQRLVDRRPPEEPTVMYQCWSHLLFLHWKWDPAAVQASLPPGLTVDTFDGSAWLGITPLEMSGVRPVLAPAVPGLSRFLELNCRTYVYDAAGRPGLYFYSLDCNQPLAVELAKRVLNLQYRHASMAMDAAAGVVNFICRPRDTEIPEEFCYRLGSAIGAAPEDEHSLEFFLIERYRLFAPDGEGGLVSVRVSHEPYQLFEAEVARWNTQALQRAGFEVMGAPDHVCAAAPLEVHVLPPELLPAGS
jgi:uncharacterized protein YqjF (DUF2071 family)